MAKIVSYTINKGGVAKTTSVNAIASVLALVGFKILIIDMDPQANTTRISGYFEENVANFDLDYLALLTDSLADKGMNIEDFIKPLLINRDPETAYPKKIIDAKVIETLEENISIIPASVKKLSSERMSEQIFEKRYHAAGKSTPDHDILLSLRKNLEPVIDKYDFVLIDSAPAIDQLTDVVRATCDSILIPVTSDSFAYEGIGVMIEELNKVNSLLNTTKGTDGIFITRSKKRTNLFKSIASDYQEIFDSDFVPVAIRDSNSVLTANTAYEMLVLRDQDKAFADYLALTRALGYITTKQENKLKNKLGIID